MFLPENLYSAKMGCWIILSDILEKSSVISKKTNPFTSGAERGAVALRNTTIRYDIMSIYKILYLLCLLLNGTAPQILCLWEL